MDFDIQSPVRQNVCLFLKLKILTTTKNPNKQTTQNPPESHEKKKKGIVKSKLIPLFSFMFISLGWSSIRLAG